MKNHRVCDFMTREAVTLDSGEVLRTAVECTMTRRIRHLPVVDENGRLVGIVTDSDVMRALPSPLAEVPQDYEELLDATPIHRIMTREPVIVGPNASIREALGLILDRRVGGLPVVEDGRLVGILTRTDLLRAYRQLLSFDG